MTCATRRGPPVVKGGLATPPHRLTSVPSPRRPFIPAAAESKLYDWNKYNFGYFINGALAGGICCSVTHGGMCPVDVVKTRIQLDPVTYNSGLIGGTKQVIAAEGAGALLTGLGPTALGYFIQGDLCVPLCWPGWLAAAAGEGPSRAR